MMLTSSTVFAESDTPLPAKISIELNFGDEWPFYEEIVPKSMRDVRGDKYSVKYRYGKKKKSSAFFDFTVCKKDGAKTYYYKESTGAFKRNANALYFQAQYSWISLPKIEGKRLVGVEVSVTNGSQKTIFLKDNLTQPSIEKVTLPPATADAPSSHIFTNGGKGYEAGKQYFVVIGTANTQLYKIKLNYR